MEKLSQSKPVLGKGLGALLAGMPNTQAVATDTPAKDQAPKDRHMGISMIDIHEIQENPFQPRKEFDEEKIKELADSIRTNGIIQPLIVRKTLKGYELIAGERRLRASRLAGLKQIPIVIKRSTDRESLEMALIENIQRENLNCVDESMAYQRLQTEFNLSHDEIAYRVGKERVTVTNSLRLLKLPETIQDDLKKGVLSAGHGKVLLGLEDAEQQLRLRLEIIDHHLSVRETEKRVNQFKSNQETQTAVPPKPQKAAQMRLRSIEVELSRKYSVQVQVKGTEKKGKIILQYNTREDLERMIGQL